jgi:putative nucleotidyltransferase with HDIG domain
VFEHVKGLPPETAAQWTAVAVECGDVLATEGMEAVQALLVEREVGTIAAIAITRELLGRPPLAEARDVVITSAARRWSGYERRMVGWAEELARGLLADELPRRWAHVQGVAQAAERVSAVAGGDAELLVASAYLHDVGYAYRAKRTGFHALDGARYLRKVRAPERVVNLVAQHSCAVLEAELRGLAAELGEFADEGPTAVRDALWWADMTTTPQGGRTELGERVSEIQQRYGPEDTVSCFIRAAEPELRAAVERTEERMRAAGLRLE